MKAKTLCYAASVALTLCWVRTASAWPDDGWTGLANNGLWTDAGNWTAGVPTDTMNSVQLDAANGWSVITIPPGEVVIATTNNQYGTIFGPEWGATLNIYGSLSYNWMMAPVQNNPAPGARSIINMFTNSSLATDGAGIGIGDAWWWFQAAPYVTLNMYANAMLKVPNLALGGHANLYDTAVANVTANIFTGNPLVGGIGTSNSIACSDGTAALVLGGGTLILPTGFTNGTGGNTVYDLIARGVIRAYGKGQDTNDLLISDDGANVVVASAPLGGALQRIYFQPLLRPSVTVGTFQQAVLAGDYPGVSGVLLSSAEPGVDPATLPARPAYVSSNPKVATVDTNGMVTAVGPGSTTLTATLGALTSTNGVTLTVSSVVPMLAHRYSFAETSGTAAADSVGGATATLSGDATFSGTGQVVLSGTAGSSVVLPPGILSNVDEVTIEVWATFPSTISTWANLFAFGATDVTPLDPNNGAGQNYINVCPHTGGATTQANFGQGLPGSAGERDAVSGGVLDNLANVQVVAVYHPLAGYEALYTNGVLAATISMFNNLIDPVAYKSPTFNGKSILAYTLGDDPLNYIGQSLYTADPGLLANIDEFRIYTSPLTAAQIAADYALGPNQLLGTSTSVRLSTSISGGNLTLKWPTTSALVTLVSSPTLGAGAVWTPVRGTLATDGSGHYEMAVPVTGATAFFRLQ